MFQIARRHLVWFIGLTCDDLSAKVPRTNQRSKCKIGNTKKKQNKTNKQTNKQTKPILRLKHEREQCTRRENPTTKPDTHRQRGSQAASTARAVWLSSGNCNHPVNRLQVQWNMAFTQAEKDYVAITFYFCSLRPVKKLGNCSVVF